MSRVVTIVPPRTIPSTRHTCRACGGPVRWARTAKFPEGVADPYDAVEVLDRPDAAIMVQPNELLLCRKIKTPGDRAPRRPEEYAARLHAKTCPGEKGTPVLEVVGEVIPLRP